MNQQEPSDTELLAFDQGLLDEPAMERISHWLESHPHGEERMARLTATAPADTAQALRHPPMDDGDPAGDPELVKQVFQEALGQMPGGSVPATVRDYQIGPLIGKGGMGAVYEARHIFMQRDVALKLLPLHRAIDPDFRARFQRETAIIGQFDHPNLVRAFDAGIEGGHLFLVMERLNGKDLADLGAARGLLPIAAVCEMVRQAALGLDHAHQHGIVHRDVKPGNLFLTRGGTVKVIDLGLARSHGGHGLTSTLTVLGTPEYIAPEQWESSAVGPPADLYALGCTLFCLLTGQPPFVTSGDSWVPLMDAHRHQPPPPLRAHCPEAPAELANLVQRLLAKAPGDRPGSAREVAELLAPFTVGHDLPALLTHDRTTKRVDRTPGTISAAPRGWRMKPLVGAAIGLAVLFLGTLGALRFLAPPQPHETPTEPRPSPTQPELAFPAELRPAHTFAVHTARVVGLAVSPDGALAASGGDDNTIWLWDLKANKALVPLRAHLAGVVTLAFSPDGKTLASATPGSEDCLVRLWDIPSGQPQGTLGGPSRGIWSLAYSPDGTLLACAGFDQALHIFEMPSGNKLHTIANVTKDRFIRTISVSEQKHVATGGTDFSKLWDAASGKEIPSNLPAHFCPTFLPGGKRLAGWRYTAGQVILCDVPSGQNLLAWRAHTPNIGGLAVSPDGRWLATTGSDGAALWSTDGKLLTKLVGHRGEVASAAFTPDARLLVTSGHDDFTVRVWELPPSFRAPAEPEK